jgi:mRNA interferase MazF
MGRGEVWFVHFPRGAGHVQAGTRPVVVVQNDAANAQLPTALVVPFTSQSSTLRFPGTVLIRPDQRNGLTLPSVALTFQMQVADHSFFLRHLGVLDPQDLGRVLAALDQLIR